MSEDRSTVCWTHAALFALAQALLWSFAFSFTYKAPALDGAEQFVWAFSLENGYWNVVLCLGFTLSKTVLSDHLHRRTRANFPGAVLAEKAQSTWRSHTSSPLRVVVSDIWLGGNLVANSARPLAVLIDGHHLKSP